MPSDQYPPGSTIKPFIGLASLDYGATSTERTMWTGPYYLVPGVSHKYRNWKREGRGTINLALAIIRSANVYFYDLAYRLGIEHIHEFLVHFELDAPLG